MKKRTGLFLILLLIVVSPNVVFGQNTASEAFKKQFPKLGGELKPEVGKKVNASDINAYRDEYSRLENTFEEIEKFENGGASSENLSFFELKNLKSLQKAKQLTELKKMMQDTRLDLKLMLKDQTKYGIDSLDALKHISMMMDLLKQKDYITAYNTWSYLFHYYPISSKNIYIKAERILLTKYKESITEAKVANAKYKETKTPEDLETVKRLLAEKDLWVDTLFMAFDQRIKYYGNAKSNGKGYILGKKGVAMYKYRKKDTLQAAYNTLDEAISLEGSKISITVLQYYFKMSAALFKKKKHDAGQVVSDFSRVNDILETMNTSFANRIEKYKTAGKTKKVEKYQGYLGAVSQVKEAITSEFIASGAGTCENLIPVFTKQYEAEPKNVDLLKKISSLLVRQKCTTSPLFEKVAVSLYALEPSANSAYMLAQLYLKKEKPDYETSAKYYAECCKQEQEPAISAKYYYDAAVVANARGKKSESRSFALKAIQLDASMGKAYMLIASLYGSTSGCGDKYQSRFVYSAAIDKLNKAISTDNTIAKEASKMMGQYRARLPQKSEIFMHNQKVGEAVKVGCWIGETTIVRSRD